MSGSGTYLANQRGWYQILEPAIAMTAGTSVSRTRNASRKTPAAKLKPIALIVGSSVNMNATKMENMMSAAAVTTRAESPVPRCTARRASPLLVYSSLIRETTSWANWADFFKQAGYAPLTPDWPDDPETVEEARANPDVLAKKTLKQVADHTSEIITALDTKPAVMGHSTGGLGAQGSGPVPGQSAHARPRDHAHVRPVQVRLGERAG
jgi:hypothetical protein